MFSIQINRIYFAKDEQRGEDGAAIYLILSPCPDNPCNHVCLTHPQMVHNYERQAFRLGSFGHRLDATQKEIDENRANVWGWDGNIESPTLRPSYLAKEKRPYTLHSFLTSGKLELCGDSTVVLITNPVLCQGD